jgi:site-specific recombinase XerD
MSELARADTSREGLVTSGLVDAAREFASNAKAESTRLAYRKDWQSFERWAEKRALPSLPAAPATVALYITALAKDLKGSTIARAIVSISQAHKLAGHDSPCAKAEVHEVMKGIRRALGVAPTQKSPVCIPELRAMLAPLGNKPIDIRDRALLLLGFAGAFRRAELTALELSDVRETDDGLEIIIRRSKTDQEGEGRKIGIPFGSNPMTCPVRAYRAWLTASGICEGMIFRRIDRHGKLHAQRLAPQAVAIIVKHRARAAGFSAKSFAGHSLRSGLLTAAAKAGKDRRVMKRQSGHRSDKMLDLYIRDTDLFDDNAASGIGL